MEKAGRPENKQIAELNRNQIARVIYAAVESMGISDRVFLDNITEQVIERLEGGSQPFPGMEGLVSQGFRRMLVPPTKAEIINMMKEILAKNAPAQEETETVVAPIQEVAMPVQEKEISPMPEPVTKVRTEVEPAEGISLTENAVRVLEKRYLKKDKEGHPTETPADMFHRVAKAIASAEAAYGSEAEARKWEEEFYRLMTGLDFLPNSPTLMNAGRELGQLSACFVLPVDDSMESIFDAVKYTALIHKSGGGTGFSFSRLRPESDRVGSTGGVASGPVSFMRAFDTATDVIKQGGMRRGANMAILNVDHPDVMKFIISKDNTTALTNFNISVAVTAEFMEAVKAGKDYNLTNPRTGEVVGQQNARAVFDKIVEMAWKTGDPGIIFIDRINKDNPTPQLGRIESTNPCGEQPLLPYESCNLGSINLARMVKTVKGKPGINRQKLAHTVRVAARFLDNVIDVNRFPLPQIAEMTRQTRKIGLGVMGFADMLIQLRIPYDSEEALAVAEDVMQLISNEATESSKELAKVRGVFPAFEKSVYAGSGVRVRNATRTTIAPTGTLSIIAGASGGIEPLFALSFTRNILDGAQLVEVNPYFEEVARKEGFYSDEMMKKLASGAHLKDIPGVPDWAKRAFVTAHEISPEWHVKMQAAFQKSTNNAVSKTVNFPRDATREDVSHVYLLAYDLGLKGITIYRDGSREAQPMSTAITEKTENKAGKTAITPRKRAKVTSGVTERVTTGCGYIYVTVNSDDQGICEVFSTLGKAGGCASAQLEATSRLISLALRAGVDVAKVTRQLRGIRCPSIAWEEGKSVLSCADAIASVLEKHTKSESSNGNGTETPVHQPDDYGLARNIAGQCPDCGGLLSYQEGCFICPACGYTKC